jgi:CRP/FNR family cyclic AMP-dependent transcriptional regulator
MEHLTASDLLDVPLLAGLSPEFRTRLAQEFEVEDHAAGHVIVREGASGYAFYVIRSGTVSVTQAERELRTLGPGDFFGEISISGEGRRTASVTATSPVVAWVLFGTTFRELETAEPAVAEGLTAAIRERLATG